MIANQVYIFGWTLLIGSMMGVLFDFFRATRRTYKVRNIWVYIQDAVFWFVVAIIIIVSTFLINEGELRGYMIIGYILGAIFYLLLFSKIVLSGFVFIMQIAKKVGGIIYKLLNKLINSIKTTKVPKKT